MRFDKTFLRQLFLRHKLFLKNLYEGQSLTNINTIGFASDTALNVLVRLLHLIANGEIPMRSVDFDLLKKSKRLVFLRSKFESNAAFIQTFKLQREFKISILKQFSSMYPNILYFLFNEV